MIRFAADERLVLASASPRRAALLRSAGLDFDIDPADVDETPHAGEAPAEYVVRVAVDKARAVAGDRRLVLAADTTVDKDGAILAKPVDDADAARMLGMLSGSTHLVHSGVVVVRAGAAPRTVLVTTEVRFAVLTPERIEGYVATGEPHDKAGAYAIQGRAAAFVEWVRGSVTNVVGLPLSQTLDLLADAVGTLDSRLPTVTPDT